MKHTTAVLAGATLGLILMAGLACKKNNPGSTPKNDFDRKPMLTNLGNNVIVPAYKNLQSSDTRLDSMITAFNTAPDADKLAALQSALKDVYKAWQSCSPFELGKADEINLNLNGN